VAAQQDPNAIVVPQRAIQDLQGKNYVWVVDSGLAQTRDVRLGSRVGSEIQIQEGLKSGDIVIVDGIQHLKAAAPVKITPMTAAAPSGA
jgi:membrane fusion protein (multidrug efflux system)